MEVNVLDASLVQGFICMCDDGFKQNWYERNGGNLSYRITSGEVEEIGEYLSVAQPWQPMGTSVPGLAGEYFTMSGNGRRMRNMILEPEANACIIELDGTGENYHIYWGLAKGNRPTSELPSRLMSHEVKRQATGGEHRVIYHAHPANVIALAFVLPLKDEVFTGELREVTAECPVVFPDDIGVVEWMVPGGRDIAVSTSELMKQYDVVIWAHHDMSCSGEGFDLTFGPMHTVKKSAQILVRVLPMRPDKLQTITAQNFRDLARNFKVALPERFLYEE